jgi:hypothetical protein
VITLSRRLYDDHLHHELCMCESDHLADVSTKRMQWVMSGLYCKLLYPIALRRSVRIVKPVHDFAEIMGAVEVDEEWIRVGRASWRG